MERDDRHLGGSGGPGAADEPADGAAAPARGGVGRAVAGRAGSDMSAGPVGADESGTSGESGTPVGSDTPGMDAVAPSSTGVAGAVAAPDARASGAGAGEAATPAPSPGTPTGTPTGQPSGTPGDPADANGRSGGDDRPAEDDAPGQEGPAGPEGSGGALVAGGGSDARRRLRAALWPPRASRGQLVVAVLLFSLGLGLAIQVRSTNDHGQLRGARQEDLVRILDELDSRQQRLQQEKTQLEQSLTQLENSSNQAKEAEEQTRRKVTELGVLAGTERATGPGIVLTIDDPQGQVKADMLLDTLQELRAAGAEAIQINDVRVVAGTYFTDGSAGGVQIDGRDVSQPFRFTVVGNPQDLTPALNIPGGVVRTLEKDQATATITQQQKVVVDAIAQPKPLRYGKPAAK